MNDYGNHLEQEKIDAANAEYGKLATAIKRGVEIAVVNCDPRQVDIANMATKDALCAINQASLAGLLIHKGLITELEYTEAMVRGLRREKERLESEIASITGNRVEL